MSVKYISPTGPENEKYNVFAPEDIVKFTDYILQYDVEATLDHLIEIRSTGIDSNSIMIGLIAPSARLLAMRWEDEAADSRQVGKAMSNLHDLVTRINTSKELTRHSPKHNRKALILSVPGEMHKIGALIASEILSQDGWDTTFLSGITSTYICNAAKNNHFDLIALSVGNKQLLPELRELILRIRKCSMNENIVVVVGGTAIGGNKAVCKDIGADSTFGDGYEFMLSARNLLPAET